MMIILRYILSAVIIATTAFSPAYAAAPFAPKNMNQVLNAVRAELGLVKTSRTFPAGAYSLRIATESSPISLMITKSTPQQLAAFNPGKLIYDYKTLARQARQVKKAKGQKMPSIWTLLEGSMMRFPQESLSFFFALGAIEAVRVIYEQAEMEERKVLGLTVGMKGYTTNPIGLEQTIDGQTDPIGSLSFAAFMAANGVASPYLKAWTDKNNPGWSKYTGYAGMAVGSMASNIVHEIAMIPAFMAKDGKGWLPALCLKESAQLMGDKDLFEREHSYCNMFWNEWMVHGVLEKMLSWSPALASMLISTAAAAYVEQGLIFAGNKIGIVNGLRSFGNVLVRGAPVLGWGMAAASVVDFGAKQAMHAGKISLFLSLDQFVFHPLIVNPLTNLGKSYTLSNLDGRIYHSLIRNKKSEWNVGLEEQCFAKKAEGFLEDTQNPRLKCEDDLDTYLLHLSEKMEGWRQHLMAPELMSQQGWSQSVSSIMLPYNAAHGFYDYFLQELRDDVWNDNMKNTKLKKTFPLNGVKPKGFTAGPEQFLIQPDKVLPLQLATIKDVLEKYISLLDGGKLQFLTAKQKTELESILASFESKDLLKISQGLSQINKNVNLYLYRAPQAPASDSDIIKQEAQPVVIENFYDLYSNLKKDLGSPFPFLKEGQGYLYYYSYFMGEKGLMDSALNWFKREHNIYGLPNGALITSNYAESFIVSMLTGPSLYAGAESTIKDTFGFSSRFNAPRIIHPGLVRFDTKSTLPKPAYFNGKPAYNIYNMPVVFKSDLSGKETRYNSLYEMVFDTSIADPNLYSHLEDATDQWWKNLVMPSVEKDFQNYRKQYQEVINRLIKKTWNDENNSAALNIGPVSNTMITALRQERKLYLMVLGELFKDLVLKKVPAEASAQALSAKLYSKEKTNYRIPEYIVNKATSYSEIDERGGLATQEDFFGYLSLLKIFKQSNELDFNRLSPDPKFQEWSANLEIQEAAINAFEKMENVLAQIKPGTFKYENGKEVKATVSSISFEDIKKEKAAVQAALKVFTDIFELNEESGIAEVIPQAAGEALTEQAPVVSNKAPSQFSEYQKSVAKAAISGLSRNLKNLVDIAMIANVVSFREIFNSDGVAEPMDCVYDVNAEKEMAAGTRKKSKCSKLTREAQN